MKKVVLFAGRLSQPKGGVKIIEAMEIVSREIPNTILLVAGDKEGYAKEMIKIAKKKNVRIVLTGFLDHQGMKAAYHSSDVVVTPSIYLDPFPTVNLEAMACSKPVVGTCFGGTPEVVVDGKTGYIVNPLDEKAMAEKIIYLLKNPAKAKKMGRAGYLRIKENFSTNSNTNQILKAYQEALENPLKIHFSTKLFDLIVIIPLMIFIGFVVYPLSKIK